MIRYIGKSVEDALNGKRSHISSVLLVTVKVVHTLIWTVFVACNLGIWAFAWRGDVRSAVILIGVVCLEVVVLAVNRGQCPMSALARRLTSDPRSHFDIFLPAWLAGNTKPIFGSLFFGGVVFTAFRWGFPP